MKILSLSMTNSLLLIACFIHANEHRKEYLKEFNKAQVDQYNADAALYNYETEAFFKTEKGQLYDQLHQKYVNKSCKYRKTPYCSQLKEECIHIVNFLKTTKGYNEYEQLAKEAVVSYLIQIGLNRICGRDEQYRNHTKENRREQFNNIINSLSNEPISSHSPKKFDLYTKTDADVKRAQDVLRSIIDKIEI